MRTRKQLIIPRAAAVVLAAAIASTGLMAPAGPAGAAVMPVSGPVSDPVGGPISHRVTDFGFDAQSYGSKTTGNDSADSGATALSVLPCTRTVPRSTENFLAEGGDGAGASVSNVRTRNVTSAGDAKVAATSHVRVESGSLASGAVTFTNLTGRVQSFHDGTGYHVTTTSSLGSLSVNGVPVAVPLDGEETTVPVPGAGTLTVNRQVDLANRLGAEGAVNVLRFDRDDGTVQRIGRAFARIDGEIEGGLFHGAAWGSDARTGQITQQGRAALQPMPCPGTRGRVLQTRTAQANTSFGFIGGRNSAVKGEQGNGSATGFARSVIDRAGFSGGALQFRNIVAVANVTRQRDGDVLRNAKGTGIGRILVNGREVPFPPAGEPQDVAGVGTFTVRTVDTNRNGIDVTAVVVRLANATPGDASDDTVVNLGRAKLAITRR